MKMNVNGIFKHNAHVQKHISDYSLRAENINYYVKLRIFEHINIYSNLIDEQPQIQYLDLPISHFRSTVITIRCVQKNTEQHWSNVFTGHTSYTTCVVIS